MKSSSTFTTALAKGLSGVLGNFGFSDDRKAQKAVINNLKIAGYFSPDFLRKQSYLIDVDPATKVHTDRWYGGLANVSNHIEEVVKKSVESSDSAEFLLDNLFADQKVADLSDASEIMVRLAQSAFGRDLNVERREITSQSWMEENKKKYLKNAEDIGLVAEKKPAHMNYDETWIMGGGRFRMQDRIKKAKAMCDSGINCGVMRLLTGDRELWAEIDQITTMEEAKFYMVKLAKKNGIEVDEKDPFDTSKFKGRTYLRYADGEKRKVTESMMAKEIFYEVFAKAVEEIVDSKSELGTMRPTTATTVKDVAVGDFKKTLQLAKDSNKDKVRVAIVSNQPFCDRQAMTSEIAVREVLKNELDDIDLEFEGIGSKSTSPVGQVHSEFGALIAEGYKLYLLRNGLESKRPMAGMLYQSRCNDLSLVPESFGEVAAPMASAAIDISKTTENLK